MGFGDKPYVTLKNKGNTVRHDDLMLLGVNGNHGRFAYNEQQLVSAKIGMSDMGEAEIQLQFSNGLILNITASKYGQETYENLKNKYFLRN